VAAEEKGDAELPQVPEGCGQRAQAVARAVELAEPRERAHARRQRREPASAQLRSAWAELHRPIMTAYAVFAANPRVTSRSVIADENDVRIGA
jgi:hypothetical protein